MLLKTNKPYPTVKQFNVILGKLKLTTIKAMANRNNSSEGLTQTHEACVITTNFVLTSLPTC